jgi:hypothetical protein
MALPMPKSTRQSKRAEGLLDALQDSPSFWKRFVWGQQSNKLVQDSAGRAST